MEQKAILILIKMFVLAGGVGWDQRTLWLGRMDLGYGRLGSASLSVDGGDCCDAYLATSHR